MVSLCRIFSMLLSEHVETKTGKTNSADETNSEETNSADETKPGKTSPADETNPEETHPGNEYIHIWIKV